MFHKLLLNLQAFTRLYAKTFVITYITSHSSSDGSAYGGSKEDICDEICQWFSSLRFHACTLQEWRAGSFCDDMAAIRYLFYCGVAFKIHWLTVPSSCGYNDRFLKLWYIRL